MGYETEAWRQPKVSDDETIIASEHGRIAFNIDYRSHWFVLVKGPYTQYSLLVQHGAGEERFELPGCNMKITVNVIASLDSDTRYLMLHHLFDIHKQAKRNAQTETAMKYKTAFVAGTLKKRKLPAQGVTKVWIEDKVA